MVREHEYNLLSMFACERIWHFWKFLNHVLKNFIRIVLFDSHLDQSPPTLPWKVDILWFVNAGLSLHIVHNWKCCLLDEHLIMHDKFSLDREATRKPGMLCTGGEWRRTAVSLSVVRGNPTGPTFFPRLKWHWQWCRKLQFGCHRLGKPEWENSHLHGRTPNGEE